MSRPLQAIVFDFDGVIANSEPLHLLAFQQTLAEDGMELSASDYYTRYLGYDDVGMFEALGRDRGMSMEANPLVSAAISLAGVTGGLAATKLTAIAFGILLHLRRVHSVIALLTVFYVAVAILPWTVLFLTY